VVRRTERHKTPQRNFGSPRSNAAWTFGDVSPVGDGVSVLRIHLGAGWRIYFTQRKDKIIILLVGGSKRTQPKDIKRAKLLAASLNQMEINHD
jgi:putative addiction module killer protein